MKSRQPRSAKRGKRTASAATPAYGGPAVVGVGASAGGLEAFSQLLKCLAPDTGMAFVLVQHLDPIHDSQLSELLARFTTMPVQEATNEARLEADHVYVIARNTALSLDADGRLRVTPRAEGRGPHLPIDHFFRSLALQRQGAAIGVVLSGTGSDGTLGLGEIKAAGGVTFVQDQATAKFGGMPSSAEHAGCVDLTLSPEGIASELVRLARHPYMERSSPHDDAARNEEPENGFRAVLLILRKAFGVDFSAYRDSTIRRRVRRRVMLHGGTGLDAYAERLRTDRAELDALYQDILINVTSFFREPDMFEALKARVFPAVLAAKKPDTPIRIWVPGCSTGQEAYSVAIALLEFLDEQAQNPAIQVFATDLSDTVSLVKARAGLYPESIEGEISPERLRRFFHREDGHYRVNKPLRDMVVFARQNVAADPPFSRVDLISCRNLLIYLGPALQQRTIPTFHYALNEGGFLVLGAAETIGTFGDLFAVVDQPSKIFVRKSAATRPYAHFQAEDRARGTSGRGATAASRPAAADWQREADRVAAGEYVPPGVLINDDFDILQFRGRTGMYLAPAAGEPSNNVLKMAREGLFMPLRSAVLECQQTGAAVRQPDVRVRGEGIDHQIELHVMPVRLPQAGNRCYLILFEERSRQAVAMNHAVPDAPGPMDVELHHLRQELAATREYLQSLIEQQDAANEELKSSSEEIMSSNEELQSTNEELETAKEELQSVNEELITVNEQLEHRNAELTLVSDDLANVLASSGLPTIVLDRELRIRRFTPAAATLLRLRARDVGRVVGNLPGVEVPALDALVADVIASVQAQEREVRGADGRWWLLRINPYRTSDHRIDGAVLVLLDIDEIRKVQSALQEARDYARAIVATVREPLLVLDDKLRVVSANDAFYQVFKAEPETTVGRPFFEIGNGQWAIPELRSLLGDVLSNDHAFSDFRISHDFQTIGHKVMVLNARRVRRDDSAETSILLALEDHTELARMEQRATHQLAQLTDENRHKTAFLSLLAHELRNPLAPLCHALQLLDRIGEVDPASRRLLAVITRQANHLTRLVDDLLDVARISRGRIALRMAPLDFVALVAAAADAMLPECTKRQIELVAQLPAQPITLTGDAVRLTQVIGNLLNNACKFTNTSGRIELTLDRDQQHAVVRVKDDGVGISGDHLPHVFDLFMQADSSSERAHQGLGIGLALAAQLVRAHGGTITADSEGPGLGSEFVVRLPLSANTAGVTSDASIG